MILHMEAPRNIKEIDAPRYIKEMEVSQILDCSLSVLRKNRHKGLGLNYYKIGSSVRYKLQDIHDFMEKKLILTEAA